MIFSDDMKILSYNKLFDVLNFDAICDMGRSSSLLSKKLAYWESSYFGYLSEVKWVCWHLFNFVNQSQLIQLILFILDVHFY